MSTQHSQNGWPLLADVRRTFAFTAGGRSWRAANPIVAAVAGGFLELYSRTVEPIAGGQLDDWSWADRPVRGSTTVASNHWSATAWDVNALRHPRGKPANLSAAQLKALRRLLDTFAPVIKWGGDFRTVVDPMHLEIAVGPARLEQWAGEHLELLTAARAGRFPGPPRATTATPSAPRVPPEDLDMDAPTLQRLVREVLFSEDTLNKLSEAVWTRQRIAVQHPLKGTAEPIPMGTALGRAASVVRDGVNAGLLHSLDDLGDSLGEQVATTVLTHPIEDDRGTWSLAERVAGVDRTVNAPMRSAVASSEAVLAPRELWRQTDARSRVALQAISATQAAIKQLVALLGQVHGVDTAYVVNAVNQSVVDAVARIEVTVDPSATPSTSPTAPSAQDADDAAAPTLTGSPA